MGMKAMYDLKEMLCKELDEIAKKGELTAGSLETVHKLTDTIKNIDKIMMLEEKDGEYSKRGYSREGGYSMERGGNRGGGGYSRAGEWEARGEYGMGNSYDEGGSSYANRGKHYVRGHYSREGGGYSREDGKGRMMRTFGELMEDADPEQRRIIERAMNELKNA